MLLAGGALVNVEEAWGQTPLFLAAQRAHRLVLYILNKVHFKLESLDCISISENVKSLQRFVFIKSYNTHMCMKRKVSERHENNMLFTLLFCCPITDHVTDLWRFFLGN